MNEEDVMLPIELRHEPARPCRPTFFGERIYVDRWQHFLAQPLEHGDGYPNETFVSVVQDLSGPLQQIATTAASFIAWLGTSCGRSYLHAADTRSKNVGGLPSPLDYFHQWQLENTRHLYMNRGIRTLEAILAPPGKEWCELTALDLETVDKVTIWLGIKDGQELIATAEAEITETRRVVSELNAMNQRAKLRALGLVKVEEESKA